MDHPENPGEQPRRRRLGAPDARVKDLWALVAAYGLLALRLVAGAAAGLVGWLVIFWFLPEPVFGAQPIEHVDGRWVVTSPFGALTALIALPVFVIQTAIFAAPRE